MRYISFLLSLFLAGCSLFTPPPNKLALDHWQDGLSTGSQHFADDGWDGPPLAPGQWVEYLETNLRGEPAHLLYRVLAEEDGDYWLEFERRDYRKRTVVKALLSADSWRDLHRETFQRTFVLEDGEEVAEEVNGPPLELWPMLYSFTVPVDGGATDLVEVPAGRFEARSATAEISETVSIVTLQRWYHAAVPITGYVRAQSPDGGYRAELVAFSHQGAKPVVKAVKEKPELRQLEVDMPVDPCCGRNRWGIVTYIQAPECCPLN
ncbi:MAG: hypothetical protein ACR2QH_06525 [Geminicoccaceae bacterium]